MGGLLYSHHGQVWHHLGHQAVTWTIRLILHHFPSCMQDVVNSNFDLSTTPSNKSVSTSSLVSNPPACTSDVSSLLSQHVSQWALTSSIHSFLSSLARPFVQSFPQLVSERSSPWERLLLWHQFFFGLFCAHFPRTVLEDTVPALCRRRHHPDLVGDLELVLVSG